MVHIPDAASVTVENVLFGTLITMSTADVLPIKVGFSGGAELLFNNQRSLNFDLNRSDKPWTLARLIQYLKDNHLKERPELFVQGSTVRPGILVLVNDTDWELMGELDYEIQANDEILFISTLHGGWSRKCINSLVVDACL